MTRRRFARPPRLAPPAHAAVAVCLAWAGAACSASDATAPADESGVYVLRSVSGAGLPVRRPFGAADTLVITAGTLVVQAPGTVTERMTSSVRGPNASPAAVSVATGTYTRTGGQLSIRFPRLGPITATLGAGAGGASLQYTYPGTAEAWALTR